MVLTKNSIRKLIQEKKLVLNPFHEDQIGPASIDLTLSNEFRTFLGHKKITLNEETDINRYTKTIRSERYTLAPGETILGVTKERVKLPANLCGMVTGRSRYARFGLFVHTSASFIQPGINNKTVLELHNAGPHTLELVAGTRICQLILIPTQGRATYNGRYKNQEKP